MNKFRVIKYDMPTIVVYILMSVVVFGLLERVYDEYKKRLFGTMR